MSASIHPTAIVEDGARLGDGVKVGPYCCVGPYATLGDGVELTSHVVIAGHTAIGEGTRIFSFAALGHPPQDLRYAGETTTLTIGRNCTIREHVSLHPGTPKHRAATVIGDNCFFMAGSHVGHDCIVGDNVVLTNNVMIAGHCVIGDFVIMGGGSGTLQFVRVGAHAFLSALAGVRSDVIPYGFAIGAPAMLGGLNLVGLKRRGFSRDAIHDLRRAFRMLFRSDGALAERVERVASEFAGQPQVAEVVTFIRAGEGRPLMLSDRGEAQ